MEELNPFKIIQKKVEETSDLLRLDKAVTQALKWPVRELIVHFSIPMDDSSVRMFHGTRVQYNDSRGPCKGGIRFHPDETLDNIRAIAAIMTWKTALVDIPLGGACGNVTCNPKELSRGEKQRLCRAYIQQTHSFIGPKKDIPGPDVFSNPLDMAWMLDEYEKITAEKNPSFITGKPAELKGSAGNVEGFALGGCYTVREAAKMLNIHLSGASISIQGFGNTGYHVAKYMKQLFGSKIVAVSDSKGGIYNPNGIDPEALFQHKLQTGTVQGFEKTEAISNDELLELEVDVLWPCAVEIVITESNADRIRAKIIAEAANGPATPKAEEILHKKNVFVIPDILCNAGGVTVSYFELVQNSYNFYWDYETITKQLDTIMTKAFYEVTNMAEKYHVTYHDAAYLVAIQRVAKVMKIRGRV